MASGAPVQDVRAQAIGRRVGTTRQDQCLVQEDNRFADARLRVADDADLEDDLGAIGVGESSAHGQRRRLPEQRHRALEVSSANSRPGLASKAAKRDHRRHDGAGRLVHASKRRERLVVSRRLDEQLRVA